MDEQTVTNSIPIANFNSNQLTNKQKYVDINAVIMETPNSPQLYKGVVMMNNNANPQA